MNNDQFTNTKGLFSLPDGISESVFVRYRPGSQTRERLALDLMQQHTIAAPRFCASLEVPGGSFLIQSSMEGIDLEDVLPPSRLRPILPGERAPVSHLLPSVAELVPAMKELGDMCAQMHTVVTPGFGNLVGNVETDGVAFTLQKGQLLLEKSVHRGWLSPYDSDIILEWLHGRIPQLWKNAYAHFVHSDLHPANIRLLQEANGQWHMQGIIDFEHAKGWYPEYDLVVVRWHLVEPEHWSAFLRGYGPIDEKRMATFEVVKLLMILSGWPLGYPYAIWAFDRLKVYFQRLVFP